MPVQTNQMPKIVKIKNVAWLIVNSSLFRLTPSFGGIFRKWRVLLLKLFGAKLDWSASVHPSSKIEYPWNVTMGRLSSIGEKAWIYALSSISIGEMSCIGKDVYIMTGSHNIASLTFDLMTKPVVIGNGCWIATGSFILPGVSIGDYSVVAANSTVTKNILAQSVVAGNPARFIKKRLLNNINGGGGGNLTLRLYAAAYSERRVA